MTSSLQPDLCRFLSWDSDFFGRRIARLERPEADAAEMDDALRWCADERIDCLYWLASSDAPQIAPLAQANDFRLVDLRLTFEISLSPTGMTLPDGVRHHIEHDIPALRRIAAYSHTDTRFYYDDAFPRERCDQLYETWIDNSCHGYAQAVLVSDHGHGATGYISCHLDGDAQGRIGLIAVAKEHQGAGLGRALVGASLAWFAAQGCRTVSVVTQGRNIRAQRMYQRWGFITQSLLLWYHRWFKA